jgi:uncharacterized protein YgbK (DUF1537 family)
VDDDVTDFLDAINADSYLHAEARHCVVAGRTPPAAVAQMEIAVARKEAVMYGMTQAQRDSYVNWYIDRVQKWVTVPLTQEN